LESIIYSLKNSKIMKPIALFTVSILLFANTNCVQKTQKRTVLFTLDVSGIKNIKSVGIRGWDKPLSWDKDYPLQEIVKDSLYQAIVTEETGRICTEFKFSINDKLELDGKENRKVYFDTKNDTTKVSFVFDKE
jgi:neutral trehalase